MRFGVCVGTESAGLAAEAGWDFVELGVGVFQPRATDHEVAPVLAAVRGLPLPVEACNSFVPGDLKLTGPAVDLPAVLNYVATAARRMGQAGVRVVVLGSGGARNLPDGWPLERGMEQLAEFLRAAAPIVAESGLEIAIEPLRWAESNIITRVGEAVRLAEWVAHPAVRVLADFFHMAEEGESPLAVLEAGSLLAHVHVADSGRTPPGEGTEDYRAILAALLQAGYRGAVSVECGWRDFATQQGPALATLRAALAAAHEGAQA